MTAELIRRQLEKEYGIKNLQELNKALAEYPGIDIGLFASPIERRNDAQRSIPA